MMLNYSIDFLMPYEMPKAYLCFELLFCRIKILYLQQEYVTIQFRYGMWLVERGRLCW